MAYTDLTFLDDFRQMNRVQTEIKNTPYGVIDALKADTADYPFLTPELEAHINRQQDRSFKMPALTEQAITSLTSESFVIPANLSTSATTTATVNTLFSGFHWYDALADTNQISKEEYINNKLLEIFKSFANAKTATLLTAIDGRKTQVLSNNPGENDGWSYATSTLTASLAAQQQRMFTNLSTIGMDNGMSDNTRMIASPGVRFVETFNEMYGPQNATNLQDQSGAPDLHVDNRITNAARFTGYYFEKGSFAMVNNFLQDFINESSVGEFAKWGDLNMEMPFINERVMTYYEEGKSDNSSLMTNSSTWKMSRVEQFGFIHKYVVLNQYNSDLTSNFNKVIKVVGATS